MKKLFTSMMTAVTLLILSYAGPVAAQGILSGGSFKSIVEGIGKFINGTLIPIVISLGIIFFLWNFVHYIQNSSNEKEREMFKKYMINSVIGIFVMVSVWGIIGIATGTFLDRRPFVPQLPTGEPNQQQQQQIQQSQSPFVQPDSKTQKIQGI